MFKHIHKHVSPLSRVYPLHGACPLSSCTRSMHVNTPVLTSSSSSTSSATPSSTPHHSNNQSKPSSSTPIPLSFIAYAKEHGSASLLGKFRNSPYFDCCLSNLHIDSLDIVHGIVNCSLVVTPELQNSYGTVHGGVITTLIDVVGTLALLVKDEKRGGVSVELNTSFLAAIKIGENIKIKGTVIKSGKTLGFTQVEIFKQDGQLAAIGRHTKAL